MFDANSSFTIEFVVTYYWEIPSLLINFTLLSELANFESECLEYFEEVNDLLSSIASYP